MAPSAFCAIIVTTDAAMLKAKNGSFSTNTDLKVVKEVNLLKGYQSKISTTIGRLTAMGLLIRARMKKQRERRYGLR